MIKRHSFVFSGWNFIYNNNVGNKIFCLKTYLFYNFAQICTTLYFVIIFKVQNIVLNKMGLWATMWLEEVAF